MKIDDEVQSATFVIKLTRRKNEKWHGNIAYVTERQRLVVDDVDQLLGVISNALTKEEEEIDLQDLLESS